jgi:transposase
MPLFLAEYSLRMPFRRWQRPAVRHLALRTMSRYIGSLVVEQAGLKMRLRSAESTATIPRAVRVDLKRALAAVERRVERLRAEALKLVEAEAELRQRYQLLTTVPGIGAVSALTILSELILLAPTMTVRQRVAFSGLDPGVPTDRSSSVGWRAGAPIVGHEPEQAVAHQPRRQPELARAGGKLDPGAGRTPGCAG